MEQDDDPIAEPISAEDFALDLADILYACNTAIGGHDVWRTRTFAEAGIRHNDGLVVVLDDHTEYQITVVRSA